MLKHIENLKQKPVHVRKRYAAAYTAIIMMVIITVWISSFKVHESAPIISGALPVGSTNNSLTANSIGAWGIIKDSLASVFRSSDSYKSGDSSSSGNIIVTGTTDKR